MKAIETKYFGPGNVRGSRIKASDGDNSIFVSYDPELSDDDNHIEAAKALCHKLNWRGMMVTGGLKRSYVHVLLASKPDQKMIFSDAMWRTDGSVKSRLAPNTLTY